MFIFQLVSISVGTVGDVSTLNRKLLFWARYIVSYYSYLHDRPGELPIGEQLLEMYSLLVYDVCYLFLFHSSQFPGFPSMLRVFLSF